MAAVMPVRGACAWRGDTMVDAPRWRRELAPAQLAEIDAALAGVRARRLSWEAVTADDFPLPGFVGLASDIRAELEDGSGIVMLRGIDPSRYELADLKILYAGLAQHIGSPVYSNRA